MARLGLTGVKAVPGVSAMAGCPAAAARQRLQPAACNAGQSHPEAHKNLEGRPGVVPLVPAQLRRPGQPAGLCVRSARGRNRGCAANGGIPSAVHAAGQQPAEARSLQGQPLQVF